MAKIASKVDSIYRTRSLGAAASGLSDQYSDGKAARVWQMYIGESSDRTGNYKDFLVNLLSEKGCSKILDAACGTGVDSVMLLEQGFDVVSVDASDKMLKYAYKTRWERRKSETFDRWVIEEGNWLTLDDDIHAPEKGFDAIICMGNSFAHLPDFHGDQRDHVLAIDNFYRLLRPGGILVIDHRNYDDILSKGSAPKKNVYYNSQHINDIKTSILYVNNAANLVTLDYEMDVSDLVKKGPFDTEIGHFRLSYYPHLLENFAKLLKEIFGQSSHHRIFGDFKTLIEEPHPVYFIHVIEKPEIDQ